MEIEDTNIAQQSSANKWGIVLAIIIGAWIVGMSIVAAGYLISKEVANQTIAINDSIDGGPPIPEGPIDIEVPAGLPVLGDNNAKVTVVEFADFQCPFCGQWHKELYPQLKKDYIDTGKIRFVYMDFAFLGDESFKAAEAAKCAADQNRFWDYHDKLFTSQAGENEGGFSDANLKLFANNIKLDEGRFNSCFDARLHKSAVEEITAKASQYFVTSTPTVFINGMRIEGILPFASYKEMIETELAK